MILPVLSDFKTFHTFNSLDVGRLNSAFYGRVPPHPV